ncbi:hypothetical protein BGX27_001126 [Mortierella sp. AM989]|nr:hypothetical protein BGX27_001126 [Mortierella sp. AM989]
MLGPKPAAITSGGSFKISTDVDIKTRLETDTGNRYPQSFFKLENRTIIFKPKPFIWTQDAIRDSKKQAVSDISVFVPDIQALNALSSIKAGTFGVFPPLGNFIFTAGAGLCLLFKADSHYVVSVIVLFVCGLGVDFTMQTSTLAVQSVTVATLFQFMRSLGQAFGITIVGTIFNRLEDYLREFVVALHYAFYACTVFIQAASSSTKYSSLIM